MSGPGRTAARPGRALARPVGIAPWLGALAGAFVLGCGPSESQPELSRVQPLSEAQRQTGRRACDEYIALSCGCGQAGREGRAAPAQPNKTAAEADDCLAAKVARDSYEMALRATAAARAAEPDRIRVQNEVIRIAQRCFEGVARWQLRCPRPAAPQPSGELP